MAAGLGIKVAMEAAGRPIGKVRQHLQQGVARFVMPKIQIKAGDHLIPGMLCVGLKSVIIIVMAYYHRMS